MNIFSFLPRNQLPNHGLLVGDKYYWKTIPATSSSSSAPQFFAEEPATWPGSGGRRQVLRQPPPQAAAWCLSSLPRFQLLNPGLTAAISTAGSRLPLPHAAAGRLKLRYRVFSA